MEHNKTELKKYNYLIGPNELLKVCLSSIHEGKELLTIEIQRPLNKEER